MSDDDNTQHYARWRNSEVSEIFIGLGCLLQPSSSRGVFLLMAKDPLGLRLWDLLPADPILARGIATAPVRYWGGVKQT
jgi:hypothetical protein